MRVLVALLLVGVADFAFAQFGRVIYASPDEKLRAVVIPTKKAEGDFHESRVEIQDTKGTRIATNDHSSPDQQHGRGVLQAGWTPDSRFFVYSTTSSGGHVAGHFNTFVYVRSLHRFFELDDFVDGPIVDPAFMLSVPSGFHSRRVTGSGEPEQFDIDLAKIPWQKT